MEKMVLSTKEKALQINLDHKIYGTLAEIGGGQEVASQFFRAGGASGTIAKTMSAYDMNYSDVIYGSTSRYVSEEKLGKMLDKEYGLLTERLYVRAKKTNFFCFANTVETLNFSKTNQGHGWLGLRFQLHPNSEPNTCIIHVVLKDTETKWQQQLLGDLGVNLVYGCCNYQDPEKLLNSLLDNIEQGRVEIDMFRLTGPDFHHVDNRLMTLKLVKNGMTEAAMFDENGNVMQPSVALYKKNVLVLRGRFRPVTLVNVDMLLGTLKQFKEDPEVDKDKIKVLAELTLNDLKSGNEIDESDFLERVDLIGALGQSVLISNYQQHYKLVSYISQFTKKRKIGVILGQGNLKQIFNEKYYENLKGGILESFGRLFGRNVRLYVYPSLDEADPTKIITCETFQPAPHLKHLFRYLYENGKIAEIKYAKTTHLHIISDNVLKDIEAGNEGWEEHLPFRVSSIIKEQNLFGYFDKKKIEAMVD